MDRIAYSMEQTRNRTVHYCHLVCGGSTYWSSNGEWGYGLTLINWSDCLQGGTNEAARIRLYTTATWCAGAVLIGRLMGSGDMA